MARTTSGEVRDLLETGGDYDTENCPSLTIFIRSAGILVSRMITCAGLKNVTFSAGELEVIETWLAAHFYCIADRTYAEKETGDSKAKFHGRTDKGLDFTPYGQQAMSLDHSGCLSKISSRKNVEVIWLGRPPSKQTDYRDRN